MPVAYLDTQIGKYALSYINDLKKKTVEDRKFIKGDLGQSFKNLIAEMYESGVMFDYSFFLYENYGNFLAGERKTIINQLYCLAKFSDAEKQFFFESGDVQYVYSEEKLKQRVEGAISLYANEPFVADIEEREYLQTLIACLILKSIQLRYSGLPREEKVKELVRFSNDALAGIFHRELIVCSLWLEGGSISFFDPVNRGAKPEKISAIVNGMAWDFIMIRNVERGLATKGKVENYEMAPPGIPPDSEIYCLPMYVSFDRRMVEVNDLFKYKGIIVPDKTVHDQYIPIADEHHENRLASIIGEDLYSEIFSAEASQHRKNHRPSFFQVSTLRRRLEYKTIELFS